MGKDSLKIAIIGIGNILFKDEGVGVYAAKFLEANYDFMPKIEIVDGATLGFRLMEFFREYDEVILIDTISIADKAGSIYRVPADEMIGLGSYRQTAHEIEVVEMLEMCLLLDNVAKVTIFGVVPRDINSVEIGLSNELKAIFERLIDLILSDLALLGVSYKKRDNVSLESVIKSLLNQKMESH